MKPLLCLPLVGLALLVPGALPGPAVAADWAVGAGPDGLAALRAQLPGASVLVPARTLLVRGSKPHVRGAAYVIDLDRSTRKLQFDNTEPDASRQWYLTNDQAWSHWVHPPDLATVKVAVIDSGIDAEHPEFRNRIAAGVSFVQPSSWRTDTCGHGTFVAGEIAANPFNDIGIAGLAFNARLLIAKVVQPDCNVSTLGEIEAIRWAVSQGARVINLSIGGLRDPKDPDLDSYNAAEQAAIEYAYSKGVLVVAAVGNGSQAPKTPWPYADYPAALPHVLGVGAVKENGSVPDYSNRDTRYVDIVAPGGPIFSTIPEGLVDAALPGCAGQAYSNCGPTEFQDGIGTSFAAPQVSAAAALLIGADPSLTPAQTEWLLERSAVDARPSTGCETCKVGHDPLTGWGMLDVNAALDLLGDGHDLPTPDSHEPNDNANTAGASAFPIPASGSLSATLDYYDDPVDVYSVKLRAGEKLFARLGIASSEENLLRLWPPGTTNVLLPARDVLAEESTRSSVLSGQVRLAFTAPAAGTYYLEVEALRAQRAPDRYRLSLAATG
jgi:subtilisin family serine protease